MNTTVKFLDAIKKRYSVKSDAQLGALLGLSRSAICHYRKKHDFLGPEAALKAAELLELPAGYVLACVEAERARDRPAVKAAWRAVAAKLAPAVLSVFIAWIGFLPWDSVARAATVYAQHTVYYVKSPAGVLRQVNPPFRRPSHRFLANPAPGTFLSFFSEL